MKLYLYSIYWCNIIYLAFELFTCNFYNLIMMCFQQSGISSQWLAKLTNEVCIEV